MSRPTSYHDTQYDDGYDDGGGGNGFALPLFNQHPPAIRTGPPQAQPLSHSHSQSQSQSQSHLPPPQSAHQHRHSISNPYAQSGVPQTRVPPPSTSASASGSTNANHYATPGRQRAQQQSSMSSADPYTAAGYPHHTQEELLIPPSSSTSFGSLARSASLGARRKDPYAYASDDVESGLGNMDMGETNGGSWQGYGQGRSQYPGGMIPSPIKEVSMSGKTSAGSSSRSYQAPMSGSMAMDPPPIPSHLSRPPPPSARNESTSPTRASYTNQPNTSMPNPYIPRGSDPGPTVSATTSSSSQWADYRPPSLTQRMPSSGSIHSPSSDPLSPHSQSATIGTASHSPLLNPYETGKPSPALAPPPSVFDASSQRSNTNSAYLPSSPLQATSSQTQWSLQQPPSPSASKGVPPSLRSYSYNQQLYPSSQPATPAHGAGYDSGRSTSDGRSRRPSRNGFREVHTAADLRPVVQTGAQGRRADPQRSGKFLSPLKCFTSNLPQTYMLCNPQFRYETSDNPRRVLTKPSKPVHNDGADNEDWDYILYVNDVLGGEGGGDRYLILDVLGQGTFGQVVKCQNMRTHDICAVKVVKNKPAYLNQSKMEVAILDLLNTTHDPRDEHHILRLHEHFIHKSHLCLVFECLSSNLYELIKQNQFKGLSTQLVKVFTQQLLDCLAVLKDARLIHCDLKPENILLKSLQSPQIKVIDFGSACHEMQTVYTYIQSRFYRSPEVLLGLPYSTSIDMWSLGCIVVELFLGLPLFPGTSEYNQISRIVDMLGIPPTHILDNGKQSHEFFNTHIDSHGRKIYKLKPMEQYASEHRTNEQPSKQYFKQTKLRDIIMEYPLSRKNPKQSDVDKEMAHRRAFVDFVEGLLNLDPIKRWSPQQAAKHPFITGEKFTGSFQPTAPSRKSTSTYPTPETPSTPSSTNKQKYGGLVQSPTSGRTQRIHSDAASYNQQLAQHQAYSGQNHSAQAASRQPFGPNYDQHPPPPQPFPQSQQQRIPSNQSQPNWNRAQPMGPPPANYQPRIPSQNLNLTSSSSHSGLRTNPPPLMTSTNPPASTYYPPSRNRANTINQMDAIPPALARLTQYNAPDPSGTRNLTPVLNRDDALREWERRQQSGHAKKPSMHNANYQQSQLEMLQEQAELAAYSGGNWMMPGQYSMPYGPQSHPSQHPHPLSHSAGPLHYSHSHGHSGHRSQMSSGGGSLGGYQMQPHISMTAQSPSSSGPYASRRDYESPTSGSGSNANNANARAAHLPAYPPPAATTSQQPNVFDFDGFDTHTRDASMGLMYTPLQPNQAYGTPGGHAHSHSARASFSGPYTTAGGGGAGSNNPFSSNAHQGQGQGGQGQGGPDSPRYHRRSQGYGA